MKKLFKLFFLLPILAISLVLSSCSSDDGGGNDPGVNPLIGTWQLTHLKGMFQGYLLTVPASSVGAEATIVTSADGNYTATWNLAGDPFTDQGQWYSEETAITLVTQIDGETVSMVWPYEMPDNNTLVVTVNTADLDAVGTLTGDYDLTFARQ
jgi:hypothetical protein